MRCPNCAVEDPDPASSDNETTTCPKCGHRFPIELATCTVSSATSRSIVASGAELERELARPGG
jgi:hypothetical protein